MNYAQDRLDRRARNGDIQIDYKKALQTKDHSLLATTLRDVGWNRHALFHYAQAWMQSDEDPIAAGDYAQMAEFCGFPEIGVMAIGAYRLCIKLDSEVETIRSMETEAKNKETLNENRLESTPPVGHCGCGCARCGRSYLFVPFMCAHINPMLDDLKAFLGLSADVEDAPSAYKVLIGRDSRSLSPLVPRNSSVPSMLRFWQKSENYRELSVELQLLWTKLLYLVCPSLAIHLVIEVKKTRRTFSLAFKSHWAYQALLESLVLGERIKPHRVQLLNYYHEPIWDVMFSCTSRHRKDFQMPTTSTPADMFVEELKRLLLFASTEIVQEIDGAESPMLQWWLPSSLQYEPLYIVGDSHVLSLAWQTLEICGAPRTVVPVVVTGLKAWHVQQFTRFFTYSNLTSALSRIDSTTILFSAGEIDCREGLGGPALEGYTQDCQEHLETTVEAFVQGLEYLVNTFEHLDHILVLPVATHSHRKTGRVEGQLARRETCHAWNRCLLDRLTNNDRLYLLDYFDELELQRNADPARFDADSTHLNSAFLPIVEKAVSKVLKTIC